MTAIPRTAPRLDLKLPPRPYKLEGVKAMFGAPRSPACSAGMVILPQPIIYLDGETLIKRAACHVLLVPIFTGVLNQIHRAGDWNLLVCWGGIYQPRKKRGTTKKESTHSWGIAVDVDVHRNQLGRKPQIDPKIVAHFESWGFEWGGRWPYADGMHFQYASGY